MPIVIVDSCVIINSFKADSIHRDASIAFIDYMLCQNRRICMPAHGWFEVWCNINRLSDIDRTYLHPAFVGGMQLPLSLVHIDDHFIKKYGNVRSPYTKAADHIFIVVALVNEYSLVSWDNKMLEVAKQTGVDACTPSEYVSRA